MLALAKRSYDTQRFALAVRLYHEALERDTALVENRFESRARYNAAASAALAGTGEGLDEAPPDAIARAKLRTQALTWLQVELDHWTKYLESAKPEQQQLVATKMKEWRRDPDLSSVRNSTKLDALAESERHQWTDYGRD